MVEMVNLPLCQRVHLKLIVKKGFKNWKIDVLYGDDNLQHLLQSISF